MKNILFIPGLLCNQTLFFDATEHLSSLISIHTAKPTQPNLKECLEAILDEAPPTFMLAGHSMGGWLAAELYKKAPNRVEKLCILNSSLRPDSDEKKKMRKKMIDQAANDQFEEVIEYLSHRFLYNLEYQPIVEMMFKEVGPKVFIHQQEMMLQRLDIRDHLVVNDIPTLIIHASNDQNFSIDDHLELQRLMPRSKLALIENCGHLSPIEAAQTVTSLLRLWIEYD